MTNNDTALALVAVTMLTVPITGVLATEPEPRPDLAGVWLAISIGGGGGARRLSLF